MFVHEFYYKDDNDEEKHAHDAFEECILIFNNEDEHAHFNDYVRSHWYEKDKYDDNIWIPYMEDIPNYNMEMFRQQYKNVQILRKMLDAFRRG